MSFLRSKLVQFSLLGLVIPMSYFVVSSSFVNANSVFRYRGAEEVLLLVWPGSIFLIGTGHGTGYLPEALSIISNVIYYALIAFLFLLVRKLFTRNSA